MASVSDWKVPTSVQPKQDDYAYDLDAALSAVVGVRAVVPPDAFTADTLGTERAGNGVLIRADGLVLTIGYLITEAETIWLTLVDGRAVPGTVLAYDQSTGFGLIQALARLDLPALRWRPVVPVGSDGWAMLALADPDAAGRLPYGVVSGYSGAGDAERKRRLFFAGLAGLGRLSRAAPADPRRVDVRTHRDDASADRDRLAGEALQDPAVAE